jgi:hypothetical protein
MPRGGLFCAELSIWREFLLDRGNAVIHGAPDTRLSDEGVTISEVENGILRGAGWEMRTDRQMAFGLDLSSGERVS